MNGARQSSLPALADPVRFCVEVLGTVPTPYQIHILRDLADRPAEIYLDGKNTQDAAP